MMVEQMGDSTDLERKNHQAFEVYFPALCARLATEPTPTSTLPDEDSPRLTAPARTDAISRLELKIGAPSQSEFDRYVTPLVKAMDACLAENKIGMPSYVSPEENFFLFVFGLAPVSDMDDLLAKVGANVVIFVEPDLQNVRRSMRSEDWADFIARHEASGTSMYFVCDTAPEIAYANIREIVMTVCPAAFGGNPYIILRDTGHAREVINHLGNSGNSFLFGLGYMFDEGMMMKNTYINLSSKDSHLFHLDRSVRFTTPVMVIGAGPSLDADIDFIRENADRCILISTGTALRSLLKADIRPDFHIELENIHIYSSIHALARECDLSGITLVVPTTVDAHIVPFFERALFYLRSMTSPWFLFGRLTDHGLTKSAPLVVNASFSFALDIGATNIYLVGTDLAASIDGPGHAKDNVLFTKDAVVGRVRNFNHEVPGNLRDTVFASDDFVLGRDVLQETIQVHGQGRRIFNCSDGARIEGAAPIRTGDLSFDGSAAQKQKDFDAALACSVTLSRSQFEHYWDADMLRQSINEFCDMARKILGSPAAYMDNLYLSAFMTLSRRLPRYLRTQEPTKENNIKNTAARLFTGTIDMGLFIVRYYLTAAAASGNAANIRETLAANMTEMVEFMRRDALDIIDHPDDVPAPKATGAWGNEDYIQESSYTYGNVSRNAPCPCGSGKRYKHCHGLTA